MKKSKLSIGLVTSFIATMAMSACGSDVTASENSVVTFNPYGSETAISIDTNSMYTGYLKSSEGVTKYYEKILEVLIRYDYKVGGEASKKYSLGQIENEVESDIKGKKDDAKESAKTNNTSYDAEWENILNSNNAENEDELRQNLIYKLEKEKMENWYFDAHEAELKEEYIGVKDSGEAAKVAYESAPSKMPYHIRHILVKNEEGGSDYNTGTLSEEQAKNLYKVVNKIRSGEQTFGRIALENSEDSSGTKFGDVGIMTNNASADGSMQMVKEFQLGIYAYDAILSRKEASRNTTINKGLGLTEDVANTIASTDFASDNGGITGLSEVPANVFDDLKAVADKTADTAGHKVLESDRESVVYPRNILWNKYLNKHNPFIITNRTRKSILATDYTVDTNIDPNVLETGYDETMVNEKAPGTCGFMLASDLGLAEAGSKMMVLTDEKDNVIIGVRSQYGIHFSVIQKSAYPDDGVKLSDYYTTKVPGKDADYPKDSAGNYLDTYVNYIKTSDQSTLNSRATEVKEAIKGFDSTYEYRLYEYLLKEYNDKLTFKPLDGGNETMKDLIEKRIALQRENNAYTQSEGLARAWADYFELIEKQNEDRINESRMVREGCVIGFMADLSSNPTLAKEYEKGGKCYYGNK